MAYKRISAVVTVRNGNVIKSYGYRKYRPGGGLSPVLRMLDRWEVDEIYVIDISLNKSPSTRTLEMIKNTKITTPVSYGGGITSVKDAEKVIRSGCERFVIGRAAYKDKTLCKSIAMRYGAQSVILSLPVSDIDGELRLPNYFNDRVSFEVAKRIALSPWISEIFLTDWVNEGSFGAFNENILSRIADGGGMRKDLIVFGGIDSRCGESLLCREGIAAVCLGNGNLENELFLPGLAERLRTRIKLRGMIR